jgi:hypothetical protein
VSVGHQLPVLGPGVQGAIMQSGGPGSPLWARLPRAEAGRRAGALAASLG